jgi:SAM-dependent methyltransferase
VEIGSGIGNLKSHLPQAISTDLFQNPWLDLVCDGYELPFREHAISHLVLFDVFHHLRFPNAFLKEARRVLVPSGRVILLEPYISLCSLAAYGLFHHEPVGLGETIEQDDKAGRPRSYYAAQGNATRLFFRKEFRGWPSGWDLLHADAFSCFYYLLSGGYSRRSLYPRSLFALMNKVERVLSDAPRVFGGRCVIVLKPV